MMKIYCRTTTVLIEKRKEKKTMRIIVNGVRLNRHGEIIIPIIRIQRKKNSVGG
jgi:hypothetical protein